MSVPHSGVPLIVLDTGVVISALAGSAEASSYKVCRAVETGRLRLAVSDRFLEEVVRTVRRKVSEGRITDPAIAFEVALDLGFHGEHHVFEPLPWPSVEDFADRWMPDLAHQARADFIVSNDPDVLDADPTPVEVVKASEMRSRLEL